ncbi:MAG: hypothetical protein IK147_02540 [Clostridia bacterium]|nr:hypothetical protein [Clostridia bacterium]
MNEVISSILQAEEKAENIVNLSAEKAKKIKLDGERAAETVRNTAVARAKVHKASEIAKAEEAADALYNAAIDKGTLDAEKTFEETKKKTDAIASEIVERILK